ncbi:E6 early protein [Bos taurus papillomavirus 32]|nr:E6 early protein [Bos taurus papillomavirus 32]
MPRLPAAYNFSRLKCVFCKSELGALDAFRCQNHRYNPFIKGQLFGACMTCIATAFTIERLCYPVTHVAPRDFASVFGFTVYDIVVRCTFCGAILTDNEKQRNHLKDICYYSVRGKIRGQCYTCYRDGRGSKKQS